MIGIIGESESDVEMLRVIVRRLCNNVQLRILMHGFNGCTQMLREGARQVRVLANRGCQFIIIAYDSDGADDTTRRQKVHDRIITPSGVNAQWCVVIPTQEIEAWLWADLSALSKVISDWTPPPFRKNPETIASPKETLERLFRKRGKRPVYAHATHNPLVAEHLDLDLVSQRCPSFRPLQTFAALL